MKNVLSHFKNVDMVLFGAARIYGLDEINGLGPEVYFEKLCRAIVGQQLSVKAAATINGRFLELFGEVLEPKAILLMDDGKMREVGMSYAKIKYVKDLARHVDEGLLELDRLTEMENEEVITELVAVKGIGQWTAEMFLMFTLGRTDVFSAGDLGLRRAMEKLYEMEPSDLHVYEKMAESWSPYRTYACMLLWKSLDNEPEMSK